MNDNGNNNNMWVHMCCVVSIETKYLEFERPRNNILLVFIAEFLFNIEVTSKFITTHEFGVFYVKQ